jgi:hypothetical protein
MFFLKLLALLAVLALPVALVWGLVLVYRKLPAWAFFLLVGALVFAPVAAYKSYERRFYLDHVPDALGVRTITYELQESWGFGPGGNEAGILVYPLSDEVARQVEQGGVQFLQSLPPNADQADRRWQGAYETWLETPAANPQWKPDAKTGRLNVMDYICIYGFCIDVEPGVVNEANEIVNSPGSYYAQARIGIIVVSPKKKKVLYFYNG